MPMKTPQQQAEAHALSEGDNGNAEISFLEGYQAGLESEEVKALYNALEACAPSWLPEKIRDIRHEALSNYKIEVKAGALK